MPAENWLYFGDGYIAKYERKRVFKKEDGTTWVRFIIIPSADIIQQYNLDEDQQYENYGMVIKEYIQTSVVALREQVGMNKILIMSAFDGSDTVLTTREQHLTEYIRNLERTLQSLKVGNARMHKEYRGAMNNIHETMKKNVDLVNTAMSGARQSPFGGMVDEDVGGAGG
jgi:hypothetical protein